MPSNDLHPLVWHMSDPDVLAHRFALPPQLRAFTSVTVFPDQRGLVFLNDVLHRLDEPSNTYLLTGDRIDSIGEGYRITQAGSEAVMAYNARITLFDMRPKEWQSDYADLTAADGEHVPVRIVLVCQVRDPERLEQCGAAFRPGEDGSQLRLSDPLFITLLRAIAGGVADLLREKSAALPGRAEVARMVHAAHQAPDTTNYVTNEISALARMGLALTALRLLPVEALCPHCRETLSLQDIHARRCSRCGETLHACPGCQALLGPDHQRCPFCREELFFCYSPGCGTYRRPERGRFCPVCKRACYPPRR
ncbi:MAG: zinc ribbon domain-containing protein [Clostridia bacterium]|nr:zinc ribbon domain-containing protein [Clostridia bacterium]